MFVSSVEAAANEVSCESINDFSWGYAGKHKTCDMDGTTKIDSLGFAIVSTKDETVAAIQFARNKKVFFLPEKANEKFPNLVLYSANECSIKAISKINFKGLKNLKSLYLYQNQIEKILSDTFEDLTSLKEIELRERKIPFSSFQIY
jgi:acid phosphatase class B